jgi:adenosylcobinamide kinase/adenosylcobinamide-phosphate guanylyltransferase
VAKHVILVTGGARSGKSKYAEQRAGELGDRRLYVATAEPQDEEMARRIAEHKKRRGDRWITIEEPIDVSKVLLRHRNRIDCGLVDCLTLWLSNVIFRHGVACATKKVSELIRILPELDFPVAFVTNEVGSGIVPDNALARQFRDLAGWANQSIAQSADEVVLMVAGIPMIVKKERHVPR